MAMEDRGEIERIEVTKVMGLDLDPGLHHAYVLAVVSTFRSSGPKNLRQQIC